MTWEIWVVIGVAVLAAAGAVVLYKRGFFSKDKAVQLIAAVTRYVRQAEALITEPKSGPEKKAYVLGFLKELFADVEDKLLGNVIDLVVAILNTMQWW